MDGTAFWFAATLAAICVGLGKGGVPVMSALSVPILALVTSPVVAAGLLLPVYIASDVFGVYAYRRAFDRKVLGIMIVAMPIGVLVGYLTVDIVPEAAVTLLVGLIGGSFALSKLVGKPIEGPAQEARIMPGLFWGAISGFTSFVSHSGAPPYQVYTLPLRMTKVAFAGTVTVAFAYINIVKLIPYYLLGQLSLSNLKVAAVMMVPAILSVFAGVRLLNILPEKLFFQIVVWALLLLSVKLIWDGLTGLL